MSQSKDEIENWYKANDPWGYTSNPDDINRKETILKTLKKYKKFNKALDIGCGEGWITQDLPAKEIHGLELSDNASSRLPNNVRRVTEPDGTYDLIVCTGVLYAQYDYQKILEWVTSSASGIVLTCNIKDWEINTLLDNKQVYEKEFPYREYVQKLRVYQW